MDAQEQKLFARFDSPSQGERRNALELFCMHLKNNGRSCRDIIAEDEQRETEIAQLQDANVKAQRLDAAQKREIKALRAIITGAFNVRGWISFNWKRVAAGAAVLAITAAGFYFFGPGTWPAAVAAREAADKGFRGIAESTRWVEVETESHVVPVAGKPYWVVLRGEVENDLHANAQGQSVQMQCLHVYATPAVPHYGVYLKPSPRDAFGGWFAWPERAVNCKVGSIQKAGQ